MSIFLALVYGSLPPCIWPNSLLGSDCTQTHPSPKFCLCAPGLFTTLCTGTHTSCSLSISLHPSFWPNRWVCPSMVVLFLVISLLLPSHFWHLSILHLPKIVPDRSLNEAFFMREKLIYNRLKSTDSSGKHILGIQMPFHEHTLLNKVSSFILMYENNAFLWTLKTEMTNPIKYKISH